MADPGAEFSFFQGIRVRIDIFIFKRPMRTKFGMKIYLEKLTQMKLIKQVLVTSSSQDHVKNLKHYISTTRVPLATKLGRMITYFNRLLPIKSYDPTLTQI